MSQILTARNIEQRLTTYLFIAKVFFKRGLWYMASYRTQFILRFLNAFVWCAVFYFMGRMMGGGPSPMLEQYGGDFFSFLVLGWAMQRFISSSLHNLEDTISHEVGTGNIEFMCLSNASIPLTFHYLAVPYMYFSCLVDIVMYLLVGTVLFGLKFSPSPHVPLALLILVLMIMSNSAIAIVSGGIILITKRGNPIRWFFDQVTFLVSGVYFPSELLPSLVFGFSLFIPLTRAMRSFRLALLPTPLSTPELLNVVISDVIYLTIFTLVVTPTAFLAFKYCLRKAKIDGSLAQY